MFEFPARLRLTRYRSDGRLGTGRTRYRHLIAQLRPAIDWIFFAVGNFSSNARALLNRVPPSWRLRQLCQDVWRSNWRHWKCSKYGRKLLYFVDGRRTAGIGPIVCYIDTVRSPPETWSSLTTSSNSPDGQITTARVSILGTLFRFRQNVRKRYASHFPCRLRFISFSLFCRVAGRIHPPTWQTDSNFTWLHIYNRDAVAPGGRNFPRLLMSAVNKENGWIRRMKKEGKNADDDLIE